MGIKDELTDFCNQTFRSSWNVTEGRKVPDEDSRLSLKNEAITISGTVLYADISGSTSMVDSLSQKSAAEVYKAFLYCCARIIRQQDGVVTAYDGDRVMGVFIGGRKNTNAAKAALNIRWAVLEVVKPSRQNVYQKSAFDLQHVTGIDACDLLVAKTGARGANDLVWVGNAANYAAKLTSLPASYSYITSRVYKTMADEAKYSNGKNMWESLTWNFNNETIYRSSWRWSLG